MDKIDHSGIEVSSEVLLVALRRNGQTLPLKSFPNTPAGHGAIAAYLVRPGHLVRLCLESTGVSGLDLALHLHPQAGIEVMSVGMSSTCATTLLHLHPRAGIEVMVANPRAVRHFAQARMQRSKTDPLDAVLLLEFAARMEFQPWQPPSTTVLHLCALARRLEALTALGTAEKNRLHAVSAAQALPGVIRQDLRRWVPPDYEREFAEAFKGWLREKAEFYLEHEVEGGPVSLEDWAVALWRDPRVKAAAEAFHGVPLPNAKKFEPILKDAVEEETVPDDETAFKPRHKQLRGKLNVPRERFRSVVSKPGHYVWAGKLAKEGRWIGTG
ncbi:MAG: IS110 family transposase [Terriglobia bacterium]